METSAPVKRARFAPELVSSADSSSLGGVPADAEGSATASSSRAELEAAQRLEWQRKLEAVDAEKSALDSGTHAAFSERCAVFESVKVDAVAKATTYKEWQLISVQKLFDYQLFVADSLCESSKRETLEKLQEELAEKRRALVARLSGVPDAKPETVRRQRALRSKHRTGDGEEAGSTAAAPGSNSGGGGGTSGINGPSAAAAPAPGSQSAPAIAIQLSVGEIQNDMREIYKDWKATAARWRSIAATALLPARVERNRLYYGAEAFSKGDAVSVFSELTKQEFLGVVHILTPQEAIVRLHDGTKCRIPLQHLRHGRVSIYRLSPSQASAAAAASSSQQQQQHDGGGTGPGGFQPALGVLPPAAASPLSASGAVAAAVLASSSTHAAHVGLGLGGMGALGSGPAPHSGGAAAGGAGAQHNPSVAVQHNPSVAVQRVGGGGTGGPGLGRKRPGPHHQHSYQQHQQQLHGHVAMTVAAPQQHAASDTGGGRQQGQGLGDALRRQHMAALPNPLATVEPAPAPSATAASGAPAAGGRLHPSAGAQQLQLLQQQQQQLLQQQQQHQQHHQQLQEHWGSGVTALAGPGHPVAPYPHPQQQQQHHLVSGQILGRSGVDSEDTHALSGPGPSGSVSSAYATHTMGGGGAGGISSVTAALAPVAHSYHAGFTGAAVSLAGAIAAAGGDGYPASAAPEAHGAPNGGTAVAGAAAPAPASSAGDGDDVAMTSREAPQGQA